MTFAFRPATRESAKLLIGLFGPSGAGKTMSALRLATGLAQGGEIVFVDTERGRACQYAPTPGTKAAPPESFAFVHGELAPPFSPDHYREAIEAAADRKPAVIIIDSVSHVWEGVGGMLDMVERAKKEGTANDFAVWSRPKTEHARLIATMLQVPAHLVVCLRGKEKRGLAPGQRGKMEVVDLGWRPICENSLPYELTVLALLDGENGKGVPRFDADVCKLPHNMRHLFPEGEQITEETGRRLAEWCGGKAPPQQTPRRTGIELIGASGQSVCVAERGGDWLDYYRDIMKRADADERHAIARHNLATLRALAAKAPPALLDDFRNELETAEALASTPEQEAML